MFGRDAINRVNRDVRSDMIQNDLAGKMQCLASLGDTILRVRRSENCAGNLMGTLLRQFFLAGASSIAVAVDRESGIWFSADIAIATNQSSLANLCSVPSWNALDAAFLATDVPHFITHPGGSAKGESMAFRFDVDADGLWGYRLPQWSRSMLVSLLSTCLCSHPSSIYHAHPCLFKLHKSHTAFISCSILDL